MEYRIGDIVSINEIKRLGDRIRHYDCDIPKRFNLNTSGSVFVGKEYFNGSYAKIVKIYNNHYILNYKDDNGKSLNLAFKEKYISLIKSSYQLIEIY